MHISYKVEIHSVEAISHKFLASSLRHIGLLLYILTRSELLRWFVNNYRNIFSS